MSIFADLSRGGYTPPGGFPNDGSLGSGVLEDNPRSAWQQLLDMLFGVSAGNDPRTQFYQNQYDPWRNRYIATAASRQDPNYTWTDFLRDQGGNISGLYDQASPQQRGENPNNYIGPVRYVGFPG